MIDRKKYLEMCQYCSVFLKNKRREEIPNDFLVIHNGSTYYPMSYSVSFDENGKTIHKVKIHDMKANSMIECLLSQIELKEN